MSILSIYILSWFGLMVIAILNGVIRTSTYGKRIPELKAHQLSCFTGAVFLGVAISILNLKWPVVSAGQALDIGAIWLVMTILFEFGFGHYIMKHSWEKLFHDYRIDKGRLWILVLIWILLAPLFMYLFF